MLMRETAKELGWHLNYASIARIWRGGCIIKVRTGTPPFASFACLLRGSLFSSVTLHPLTREIRTLSLSYSMASSTRVNVQRHLLLVDLHAELVSQLSTKHSQAGDASLPRPPSGESPSLHSAQPLLSSTATAVTFSQPILFRGNAITLVRIPSVSSQGRRTRGSELARISVSAPWCDTDNLSHLIGRS
jgi:6-phosphogluconate dehydrogenase-like protein